MNYVLKRVAIAFAVICVTGMAHAQWRGLRTTQLGPAEGLNMRVNHVVQGPGGYIYMGGTQGLVRYDGSEFELFAHDPDDSTSIGPGEIYNLIAGSDGLLWIGLRYGGLNSFDPVSGKFQRYPLPKLPYYMTPTAHGLLEDENGCLWVGGHHFQLLCFDRETKVFTAHQPDWIDPEKYGRRLSIASIIQSVIDPDMLWLSVVDYSPDGAGGYGLASYDKRDGKFTEYPNAGRNAIQDSLGNLYGTHLTGKLSRFSTATGKLTDLPFRVEAADKNMARGIIPIGDKYWVNTNNTILSMDGSGDFELLYKSRDDKSAALRTLYSDNESNIWISSTQGVTIVNPGDQNIRYFSLDQFGGIDRIFPGRLAYDAQSDYLYLSHSTGFNKISFYRIISI